VPEETVAPVEATESGTAEETLVEAPKPTTAEIVAAARAEREKPAAKPSSAAPEKSAEADKKTEGDEKVVFYTAEQLTTMDLRSADLNKVSPELRTTVKGLQAAENKKHAALNQRLKELEEQKKPAKPEPEEEEQLFTDDEIDKMLGSKKGQAKLDKWAADRGLDFEQVKTEGEQRLIRNAVEDATEDHPELKDEKFFDETADAIANNAKWAQTFADNRGNRKMLSLIFEAAAASVKLARAATKAADVAKEKEAVAKEKDKIKTQKEAANARNQVTSIPVKKPGSGGSRTTLDILKEVKAARKSI
jgi:hypothetical protein